ncbi:MAG TPA: TetR/AcrR family transcriptional regulator [Enorma massiliensis]|uniref:TetR/AcrR family transcriptional regulator n=1 Tax=Enorma massiliensis TaxID=1472761 RepID=UPI001DD5AD60|nr:TetR/AcrR family transcriptional regulator [Enorma massiliensis]HJG62262.1 TetR/AcrR family transcriptional regulator [Enorma massiliensis]
MPAIFTQRNRDELYRRMIEVGWEQLVEGGIRSLRVERVAAAVGIAKGTFYHFFDSKDDLIYAMLMENRQHAMDVLERVREEAGAPLDRACMRSWLELLWRSERNIFRIATAEEYRYLVRSLPSERTLDPASDGALVRWIVDEVANARPGVDVAAVQNLQFVLALTLLNRGLLRVEALERTVDALIDDTLDELFGKTG